MASIYPANDFILVERITETVTQNDFVVPDEAKGDGIVLKCKLLRPCQIQCDGLVGPAIRKLEIGDVIYVPEYSLRQIEGTIMACSIKSLIAYES